MRAREFIREQTATMPAPSVPMPDVGAATSKTKDIAKKVGSKTLSAIDKVGNVASYAQGAGIVGDQSAANFVGDQVKMRNAGIGLELAANLAQKSAPTISKTLGALGTVAKTGTGPVGTALTLGLRSGDAGAATGPYADTISGRNAWMTKHGYDPNKPEDYARSVKDYQDAKKNWEANTSWGEKINRILNPFADTLPSDDEIMASRKPNVK